MCQNYILKNKEEKYLEILTTLLKYIIEHQSDFQESNRIYEYMRTISYASKYLEDETYIKRVEKLLIKIDTYSCKENDKYKIMMQLLNLFIFYRKIFMKIDDQTVCIVAEKLKDVKDIDIESKFEFGKKITINTCMKFK